MTSDKAATLLKKYRIAGSPAIFVLGCFDKNVTVLSQQIRALNLAHCLVETETVPSPDQVEKKIAIIGAGFAGLTLAAALIRKRAALNITIFEERDALLPLQQGSDSRWLHPHIYHWPALNSDASVAMLPVLNWTAARASDVVVQVLSEWRQIVRELGPRGKSPRIYCNTRHLHIASGAKKKAQVEWIGERRDPETGYAIEPGAVGFSEGFDFVVLAVGFGLEKEATPSYWRNETLGQPDLLSNRTTYLVSGQGDGAMIDLQRLRISQYRQDRILEELFNDKADLLNRLQEIKTQSDTGKLTTSLFDAFERIAQTCGKSYKTVCDELRLRLRRDTDVILRMKSEVRSLEELIQPGDRRMSFQNALMAYLLYKCGGFAPSNEEEQEICSRLGIKNRHVIRRHGPPKPSDDLVSKTRSGSASPAGRTQYGRILSAVLARKIRPAKLLQPADVLWSGGYFGFPGRTRDMKRVADKKRAEWRKEYLPGPTAILAAALAGAVSGAVNVCSKGPHRVTLHRVLELRKEVLLQQCCDYAGAAANGRSTAGRTFPAEMATIGQAFACQMPIRSRKTVSPNRLSNTMNQLQLKSAARNMRPDVRFVLAIPILQPEHAFFGSSPVAGVVYIDSVSKRFWLSDEAVVQVCEVITQTLRQFEMETRRFDRVRNIQSVSKRTAARAPAKLSSKFSHALEVAKVEPPRTAGAFQFNLDFSDLTPLMQNVGASA